MDRAVLVVAGIALLSKLLGAAEKQLTAFYFGADYRVDAFYVALSGVMTLFLLTRELIEPSFLPVFARHVEGGRRSAAGALMRVSALGILGVLGPVVLLAMVTADEVAFVLAPGFNPVAHEETARLIRFAAPAAIPLALSALTYIALNAEFRFGVPASGDLVWKGALAVAPAVGIASGLGVEALAYGLLIGAAGRLATHLFGWGATFRMALTRAPLPRDDLATMRRLMAPLVLGVLVSQLGEIADNAFSSTLAEGSVAARTYARKIAELPILLVPYSLSIVLFPRLTRAAQGGQRKAFFSLAHDSIRAMALGFVPIALCTWILAEPIVQVILEHGAFDGRAKSQTVAALAAYSLALPPLAIEAVLVPSFFALGDTRTPVTVGILTALLDLALTAVLVGSLDVAGVALSLGLARWVKVSVLLALLTRQRPEPARQQNRGSVRRIAAAGIAGLASGLSCTLCFGGSPQHTAQALVELVSVSVAVFAVFGVALLWLGGPEAAALRAAGSWLHTLRKSRKE